MPARARAAGTTRRPDPEVILTRIHRENPDATPAEKAAMWVAASGREAFDAAEKAHARIAQFVGSFDHEHRQMAIQAMTTVLSTNHTIPASIRMGAAMFLPAIAETVLGWFEERAGVAEVEAELNRAWQSSQARTSMDGDHACLGTHLSSLIHRVDGCPTSRIQNQVEGPLRNIFDTHGNAHAACPHPACFGPQLAAGRTIQFDGPPREPTPPPTLVNTMTRDQAEVFGLASEIIELRSQDMIREPTGWRFMTEAAERGMLNHPTVVQHLPTMTNRAITTARNNMATIRRLVEEERRLHAQRRALSGQTPPPDNDRTPAAVRLRESIRDAETAQRLRDPVLNRVQQIELNNAREALGRVMARFSAFFNAARVVGREGLNAWQIMALNMADTLDDAVDSDTRQGWLDRFDRVGDMARTFMTVTGPNAGRTGLRALQNWLWANLELLAVGAPALVAGFVGMYIHLGAAFLWTAYILSTIVVLGVWWWNTPRATNNAPNFALRSLLVTPALLIGHPILVLVLTLPRFRFMADDWTWGELSLAYWWTFMIVGAIELLTGSLFQRALVSLVIGAVNGILGFRLGGGPFRQMAVALFNAIPFVPDIPLPSATAPEPPVRTTENDFNRSLMLINMVGGVIVFYGTLALLLGSVNFATGLAFGAFLAVALAGAEYMRRITWPEERLMQMREVGLRVFFFAAIAAGALAVLGLASNTRLAGITTGLYSMASDRTADYFEIEISSNPDGTTTGRVVPKPPAPKGAVRMDPAMLADLCIDLPDLPECAGR